ncbi:MAG: dTMP kinase [Candidatus Omnitrophica bacterium]|nr:dTMP kinase [Candidatus Omnitrophota bacterium]
MAKRGLFITFEGPEGSGKSTHSRLLCNFLRRKGFRVLYTREPGGTLISEKIRKVLLDPKNKGMDAATEMLLYMAARVETVKQKILPALEKQKLVVCDRFLDATVVYQGYAGGLDLKLIKNIGRLVTSGISPDLTFLLDIDVKHGLRRAGETKDRMERKSILYHKKVRKGYLAIAREEPRRMKVFSAVGDIEETQGKIRNTVLKLCHSKI